MLVLLVCWYDDGGGGGAKGPSAMGRDEWGGVDDGVATVVEEFADEKEVERSERSGGRARTETGGETGRWVSKSGRSIWARARRETRAGEGQGE